MPAAGPPPTGPVPANSPPPLRVRCADRGQHQHHRQLPPGLPSRRQPPRPPRRRLAATRIRPGSARAAHRLADGRPALPRRARPGGGPLGRASDRLARLRRCDTPRSNLRSRGPMRNVAPSARLGPSPVACSQTTNSQSTVAWCCARHGISPQPASTVSGISAYDEHGTTRVLRCCFADAGERHHGGQVAGADDQQPRRLGCVGERLDCGARVFGDRNLGLEFLA